MLGGGRGGDTAGFRADADGGEFQSAPGGEAGGNACRNRLPRLAVSIRPRRRGRGKQRDRPRPRRPLFRSAPGGEAGETRAQTAAPPGSFSRPRR